MPSGFASELRQVPDLRVSPPSIPGAPMRTMLPRLCSSRGKNSNFYSSAAFEAAIKNACRAIRAPVR